MTTTETDASKLFQTMLRKRLLALGAVILAVSAILVVLWLFTDREAREIRQSAKKRIEILTGLDTISNLSSQKNKSVELLIQLQKRLPPALDAVIESPKTLKRLADLSGVRLQVDTSEGDQSSVSVRIKADGSFTQVLDFAKRIETGDAFYKFEQFEINPSGDGYQLYLSGKLFIRP